MNQGLRAGTLGAVITVAAVGAALAQGQKPAGAGAAKSVMHDIVVTTSDNTKCSRAATRRAYYAGVTGFWSGSFERIQPSERPKMRRSRASSKSE